MITMGYVYTNVPRDGLRGGGSENELEDGGDE